jgi:acetyltransferase
MLEPFFNPRGVAIIGASSKPKKLGHGIVRNLIRHHYRGAIYPVNPTADEILGLPCYPSVKDVPDPVDLAVIVVPARAVASTLEACGQRGIGHAIIISGGFGETGEVGRALESKLRQVGSHYNMRLIGPNCTGAIDTHTPVNSTFVVGMPQAGDIAFVSQSGAMCAVVIDWAQGAGIGFSRIISLGNQVDVNESEMLVTLTKDPQTKVITAYIEGVTDGRLFMEKAWAASRCKPVILLKGGRGEGGTRAVASHTGALAGSVEAYDAAFSQCGVLRAETTEELFDWAQALAWQPLPVGDRVAVLTNAGGPGIMAVNTLEAAGLKLAHLTEDTQAVLRERLPPAGSAANPVDILAGSGPDLYALALKALLSDPEVDAVLVVQAPQDWFSPADLAQVLVEIAADHEKPVLASLMGWDAAREAQEILHGGKVPNYPFPERAASALAAMAARREWLQIPVETPEPLAGIDRQAAQEALERGDFAGALAAYGLTLPPTVAAGTPDLAIQAAGEIGYPVALKLDSPDLTHKSDIGGVILNLDDDDSVAEAFEEIFSRARAARPEASVKGVIVQKMVSGGLELIAGTRSDPQFGALILAGSGGVEVELERDVAIAIAPLSDGQAQRLLDATNAGTRLGGWRGLPPFDRPAAVEAIRRLAQLAVDFPQIAELEINPLCVLPAGQGAYAIDIRWSVDDN